MQTLTPQENLVAHVARATCFGYRFESGQVPENDLTRYVEELIALFRRKPYARLLQSASEPPDTVASTLEFCATQLDEVAPEQASKLRLALTGDR